MNKSLKYIVCINRAGLGNRLKGLISAMRLSKITGRKLLLYWENNQYCGCDFNDLFENKFKEITKKELNDIKKKNSIVYRDVLREDYDKYDYIILDTWKFVFLPNEIPKGFNQTYSSKEGDNIDFEFERIPERIRKMLLGELLSLRVLKEIKEFVESFNKRHDLGRYVGLHIRRGDNRFTVDGREKISSDEKFIEIINKTPNEKFLLTTDGEDTKERFRKLFGERIIIYPEEKVLRSDKESIKQGLISMLLLSKTKHIFGSYLSTFAELAWWFGGCKPKINIVGIEDVKNNIKQKSFYKKILRKMRYYKVNFLRWVFRVYR